MGGIFVRIISNLIIVFFTQELKRCGLPSLRNKGIDTVEISTVIFADRTEFFRLNDFSNQPFGDFNTSKNPPQAE